MHRRILGLLVGGLLLLAPALAVAGPVVSVRVEGQNDTLLPATSVELDPSTPAPVNNCPGNSAAAALEKATNGNWDRQQFTQTILGETHSFSQNDYWAEWVDNKYGGGLCNDLLQDGDQLLMLVDISDSNFNPTVFPIVLTGVPASVSRGQSFTATVTEYRTTGASGTSTPTPAADVTVAGGGASATTDADGHVTLSLSNLGATTLRATKGGERSSPVAVCVHDGDDGSCGTTAPGSSAPGAVPCVHVGDDGRCGTVDRTDPIGRIVSPTERQRFGRGQGPRTLSGSVAPDPSGLLVVKLRLTRRSANGHCSYYSGRLERFRPSRCGAGHGAWFAIGDRQEWSYLLPAALPAGRYVLDVDAIDRAANRDDGLQRGRNRVVFVVG